jgi:hypothetical protein
MSAIQAAHYLGFKSTGPLRDFPIKPIVWGSDGRSGRPMYDRHQIDHWLDEQAGISSPRPLPEDANEAEAAFAAWKDHSEARHY